MQRTTFLPALTVLVLLAGLSLSATPARATSIWIEGEAPAEKDVSKHGWYDAVKKEGMSGGDWLSHYDQAKPGTATYRFEAPEAGQFTFWFRGNTFSKVSYALERRGACGNRFRPEARRVHDLRQARPPLPGLDQGGQRRAPSRRE